MDTRDIVDSIRHALLEWDANPISNEHVLSRVNQAYAILYQHFIRSQDSMFGQYINLQLRSGVNEYDIPKDCIGKRIEQVEIPVPPQDPYTWIKLEKVDAKRTHAYNTPKVMTIVPAVWSQLGNKLMIYPKPSTDYVARVMISRRLTPLSYPVGRITFMSGNQLTLDSFYSEDVVANQSDAQASFVSIVDFRTGETKKIYHYTLADGNVITLDAPPTNRTTLLGQAITPVDSLDAMSIAYDPITKQVTAKVVGALAGRISAGDVVEVEYKLNSTEGYYTQLYASEFPVDVQASVLSQDGYFPPDSVPASLDSPFSTTVTVLATNPTVNHITWSEPNYSPMFVGGVLAPVPADLTERVVSVQNSTTPSVITLDIGSNFGSIFDTVVTLSDSWGNLQPREIMVSVQTYPILDETKLETSDVLYKAYTTTAGVFPPLETNSLGYAYDRVTLGVNTVSILSQTSPGYGDVLRYSAPHDFVLGSKLRLDLIDNCTAYVGASEIYKAGEASSLTQVQLPFLVGAKFNGAKISDLLGSINGIPDLLSNDVGFTPVTVLSIHKGTPNTFQQYTTATWAYDPINNVELDDMVCLGATTCVPVTGEFYNQFLIDYAVLMIRASLHEVDDAINQALKILLASLKSDTAGRPTGVIQTRDFNGSRTYHTPTRRGRR